METAKRPTKRLVTVALEGDQVPEYGAAVTAGGEAAGTLTSPCLSPTLGRVIGLAVLETDLAVPGRRLEVALAGGTAPATVESLPIYDSGKTRPRSGRSVPQPA